MIKKLFFTLSLIFLFVFLCIEQSAFSVIGICFLLILILIIDEIIVRKKTKHSFKPNTTDLDNLENSLLLVYDYKTLCILISKFLVGKFLPKFICVAVISNDWFSVQHYEEHEQSNHILYRMMEERKNDTNQSGLIVHKSRGVSFPFFKNNK